MRATRIAGTADAATVAKMPMPEALITSAGYNRIRATYSKFEFGGGGIGQDGAMRRANEAGGPPDEAADGDFLRVGDEAHLSNRFTQLFQSTPRITCSLPDREWAIP